MKPKILFILFTFTSILNFSFSQNFEKQIAVLDLDPIGITDNESKTLTDRLRSELVSSDEFTVIERNEMNEILKEQGFQQTGCTSDACAVEIGRLLNVHRIVAGSIGKVGDLYTISLRMIDVETGVILFTVTEDCACPIEKVLTTSMKNIAQKLVDMSKGRAVSEGILTGSGDIYLKSDPSGASVTLDGKSVNQVTPTTLRGIAAGEHRVKVVRGDYVGSKVVNVLPNEITQVTISLSKAIGGLKVYSNPPEANIYRRSILWSNTHSDI